MAVGREGSEVGAHLGENCFRAAPADARDGLQAFERLVKRAEALPDLLAEATD